MVQVRARDCASARGQELRDLEVLVRGPWRASWRRLIGGTAAVGRQAGVADERRAPPGATLSRSAVRRAWASLMSLMQPLGVAAQGRRQGA